MKLIKAVATAGEVEVRRISASGQSHRAKIIDV